MKEKSPFSLFVLSHDSKYYIVFSAMDWPKRAITNSERPSEIYPVLKA